MLSLKSNHILKHFPSIIPLFSCSSSIHTDQITYLNCHINYFLSNKTSDLQTLSQSHAYIITTGNSNNVFIAAKLIAFYASLHKPSLSTKVFDSLTTTKDSFLWNSIIKSHFSNGDYPKALEFYFRMRLSDSPPDHFTIPMVVTACAELMKVNYGKNVHGLVSKLGVFAGNSAVGSSFVYMYSKCGVMVDAALMFDEISDRDVVAWTALVIGYVQNDESEMGLERLCEMHRIGGDDEKPNSRTLEGGFRACGNFGDVLGGRCLHGLVVKTGIGCSPVVQSSLLSMYSKCGTPEEAYISFGEVWNKDLIVWTSMIGVYARLGCVTECLGMFSEMEAAEICPDGVVISCMLSGFGNSMRVSEGKAFHGLILRRDYVLDQVVCNALMSMYSRFGMLTLAEKLFDRVNEWNKEPWNMMVVAYSKVGMEVKCLKIFMEMKHQGIESDANSLVSVISSCSQLGAIHLGQSLHCYTIRSLMDENVSISNSLIDMYGKCGNLTVAWRIFCRMQRDIVSWNTLISVYTHSGDSAEALKLFDKMILEDMTPNSATLVTVLSACSNLSSLENGERIHDYIENGKFNINIALATSLIDMYAKCGHVEKSREIFNSINERDVIFWNAMISGYGMHGDAKSALEIFEQMEKSSVRPNGLTFLAILSACTHAGLVEEGELLFRRMQDYSVAPNLKHYACMVDLLGKSGRLQEAEALVLSMPITPDKGVWGALLSACNIHNEIEMGIRIAKHAVESDPENDAYYIMISNMYSSTGRWDEAEGMREIMKERGVKKKVGWSAM